MPFVVVSGVDRGMGIDGVEIVEGEGADLEVNEGPGHPIVINWDFVV